MNIFTAVWEIMLIGLVAKMPSYWWTLPIWESRRRIYVPMLLIQANHAIALGPILMTTIKDDFRCYNCISKTAQVQRWIKVCLGNYWWFNVIIIPYINYCTNCLFIVWLCFSKMGKHEKIDYEAEMKADYVHKELSETVILRNT